MFSLLNILLEKVEIIPFAGPVEERLVKDRKLYQTYLKKFESRGKFPFYAQDEKEIKKKIIQSNKNIFLSLRGGYGSYRFENIDLSNKIIIGYSDLTYLFLTNKSIKIKIHGPMYLDFFQEKSKENLSLLIDVLTQKNFNWSMDLDLIHGKKESFEGEITGGNLTMLHCALLKVSKKYFKNKILLLEDVGEDVYSIHRKLIVLKQSGYLDEIKALVFGTFQLYDQKIEKDTYKKIIQDVFKEVSYPVYFTKDFGHHKINKPFIYDQKVKIKDLKIELNNKVLFSL